MTAPLAQPDRVDDDRASRRPRPARLQAAGIALAAAFVGLLPWLVSGLRLPLQNLWAEPTAPEAMPLALLPFNQYRLFLIAAIVVIAWALAGVVTRLTRRRVSAPTTALVLLGLHLLMLVQTTATVAAGLRQDEASVLYLAALVVGTGAAIALGCGIWAVLAFAPPAGVVLAASVAGVLLVSWVGALVLPDHLVAPPWMYLLVDAISWLPAVVTGIVIGWAGVRTPGRVAAALGALVVIWVAPALITGVSNAAGTRVLAAYPAEMLAYAGEVTLAALGPDGVGQRLVIAAVVIAAVVLGIRLVVRRTRAGAASS